jgi:hypothetical protein
MNDSSSILAIAGFLIGAAGIGAALAFYMGTTKQVQRLAKVVTSVVNHAAFYAPGSHRPTWPGDIDEPPDDFDMRSSVTPRNVHKNKSVDLKLQVDVPSQSGIFRCSVAGGGGLWQSAIAEWNEEGTFKLRFPADFPNAAIEEPGLYEVHWSEGRVEKLGERERTSFFGVVDTWFLVLP